MLLHEIIEPGVRDRSAQPSVVEGNGAGQIDYATLGLLSDRLRDWLIAMNLGRGDRAGIYLRKSVESVVSIVGILKAGAAYVPVDPSAPASRNAYIHHDCGAKVVITERRFE